MVVQSTKWPVAFDYTGEFCSCQRLKMVRAGTDRCEPCHAVDAYRAGRYAMNLRGLCAGSMVFLHNGREALIKRGYRRDPNSPVTMYLVKIGHEEDVIDISDIKGIIHL